MLGYGELYDELAKYNGCSPDDGIYTGEYIDIPGMPGNYFKPGSSINISDLEGTSLSQRQRELMEWRAQKEKEWQERMREIEARKAANSRNQSNNSSKSGSSSRPSGNGSGSPFDSSVPTLIMPRPTTPTPNTPPRRSSTPSN